MTLHVRDSGIRENLCSWNPKSGISGFGIWNTAQTKRNPTKDWNPEIKVPLTKTEIQYLESRIQGGESRKPLLFWIPLTREDKLMHSFGNEN